MRSLDLTGYRVEVPPEGKIGIVIRHEPCDTCTNHPVRRDWSCGYDDVIVEFENGTRERHYEPEVIVVSAAAARVSVLSPEHQQQEERMNESETTFGTAPVEAPDTITGETEGSPAEPESPPQEEPSPEADPESTPEPESDTPEPAAPESDGDESDAPEE